MSAPNLRDMWLSELWGKCPELSYGERAGKRLSDRKWQRELEEQEAIAALPQVLHRDVLACTDESTGCAENGGHESSEGPRECA